ncbi:hypothetical protein Q8A67_007986 [Cirrhinus molitorella]|uniref:Uncharacterized protein n=1 Tax=Cirrhinus molitorella TaxID=172907 RepID=A0AA88Q0U1_9TELE|nr:hypothetical protein Q8A67_007986 [Cirrhinus molitorella]
MSLKPLVDFEISDSEAEYVSSNPAVHRSSRLQSKDSPWASWPSEKIFTALDAVSIPFNREMPQKDLLLLALNTLGCPSGVPTEDLLTPASSVPPKSGGKRTAKSSPKAFRRLAPSANQESMPCPSLGEIILN